MLYLSCLRNSGKDSFHAHIRCIRYIVLKRIFLQTNEQLGKVVIIMSAAFIFLWSFSLGTQFRPTTWETRSTDIFFFSILPRCKINPWPPDKQASVLATKLTWLPFFVRQLNCNLMSPDVLRSRFCRILFLLKKNKLI